MAADRDEAQRRQRASARLRSLGISGRQGNQERFVLEDRRAAHIVLATRYSSPHRDLSLTRYRDRWGPLGFVTGKELCLRLQQGDGVGAGCVMAWERGRGEGARGLGGR